MNRGFAIAWFAVQMGAGCGRIGFDEGDATGASGVTALPPYLSGTRLRASIHQIGSAKRFAAWFDTQLGEECVLAVAEDGVVRCVPSRIVQSGEYADSSCITPLLGGLFPIDATDCPSADSLATMNVGNRRRVVRVGAMYSGTTYVSTGGGCVMAGGSPDLFQVGATVAPEMFVAFHDEYTPSGDLAYIEHVGDDGARVLATDELVVRATGQRCQLVFPAYGEVMCLYPEAEGNLAYADAACTEPVVYTFDAVTPRLRVNKIHDTCRTDAFDAEVGAEVTTLYSFDTCVALNPGTSRIFRLISLDPVVPVATGVLDLPAGGPVVVANWKFSQGQSLPQDFYDTRHRDSCEVTSIETTLERVCAPLYSGYAPVYQDAACATPINAYPHCRGSWRAEWIQGSQFTCEGLTEMVYVYDQPIAGPYYDRVDGACTLADPVSVQAHAESATPVPISEMAPVTRHLD